MAEIDSSGGGGKGGKQRAKKQSTKIDMTPMVDLGFLLITFFMLTTTLQKPSVMPLNMPDKDDTNPDVKIKINPKESLAIIPGKNDKVYYFQGNPEEDPNIQVQVADYSKDGIRKILKQFVAATPKEDDGKSKFVAVIKPLDESNYKNMVDILDEMAVCKISKYAIVDVTQKETDLVKNSPVYVK
jgi:biopolymer transport protein ExbD